ncbi:hypothetical protein DFJ74DRAFT_769659 [Hyaloraphidium curvatum]|nr:hypothetical protein DFJ74DRAFT_769659 [Hyaloraphidium curvatum]
MATPEQILDATNRLRTNPAQFIPYLESQLARFQGNILQPLTPGAPGLVTQEGSAAVQECIEVLRKQAPVGALSLSPELCLAAADHCADTGPKGITGHTGSDGSSPQTRIERHCDWLVTMGENIAYGTTEAEDIVMQLCVDDGVPSRGHRTNLFKPDFKVVGIATGPHASIRTMCTQVFAGGVGPKGSRPANVVTIPAGAAQGGFSATITDATAMTPEVQKVLDAIPFAQMKDQVTAAFASGKQVDLDLTPGSIAIKIKDGGGWSSMSGTWG